MRFVVAVVVVIIACSGVFAQHAAAGMLENCMVVGELPLVVTRDAQCYQFKRDITYSPVDFSVPAIEWFGFGGELHFRGYTLTLDTADGGVRGIRVSDQASLRVFDARLAAPELTYYDSRAFQVQDNATLEVYNADVNRVLTGCYAFDRSVLVIDGYQFRATVNRRAPTYRVGYPFPQGVAVYALATATLSHLLIDVSQGDQPADTPGGLAAYSYGVTTYFQGTPEEALTKKPTILVRSSHIRAHSAIGVFTDQNLIVEDTTIELLPVLIFPGDIRPGPTITGDFGYPVGVALGLNAITAQATLRSVDIDMTDMTTDTESAGLAITATHGVDVDGLTVYGHSYLSDTDYVDGVLSRERQLGFITVTPWASGEDESPFLSPIRLRNVNLFADDNTTVGVQVLSDSIVAFLFRMARTSITLERSSVVGGAVGVLTGSQSRQSVVVRDCDLSTSYYGFYAYNESRNQHIDASTFNLHCVGVYQDGGASELIVRDASFEQNSVPYTFLGSDFTNANPIDEGTTGVPCALAPFIYDSAQIGWLLRRRADPAAPRPSTLPPWMHTNPPKE